MQISHGIYPQIEYLKNIWLHLYNQNDLKLQSENQRLQYFRYSLKSNFLFITIVFLHSIKGVGGQEIL
jgi:hypothetical protein